MSIIPGFSPPMLYPSSATPFDPASLFGGGEAGGYFDTNPARLWQDAAGTVAVTTATDPVRRLDWLGGGHVATAPSDAYRPLYNVNSGKTYLDFNGGQGLQTGAIDFSANNEITIILRVRKEDNTFGIFTEFGANSGTTNNTFSVLNSAGNQCSGRSRGSSGAQTAAATAGTPALDVTLTMQAKTSTPLVSIQVDNGTPATNSSTQGGTNYANTVLNIGARDINGTAASWLTGWIYAGIIIGRLLSAPEIANAKAWVENPT